LAGAQLITETLKFSCQLPATASEAYIVQWEEKLASVDEEFLTTSAMRDQGWTALSPKTGVFYAAM
jgi:hypothetical protein